MYKKGLFNQWVPKLVQLVLILTFVLPLLAINGVYANNLSDMVGQLGVLSEELTMANYAATIGMVTVFPLLMRIKQRFKSRQLLLFTFICLTGLTYICATTENTSILIATNFLIGFVKMIGVSEVILPLMLIISPQGDRAKFYSVFYPATVVLGMSTAYFTTGIAYDHNWLQVYSLTIPILLFCALLTIIFCHNSYGAKPVPIYQFDWLSMTIFGIAMMLLNYACSYARMLNWFESLRIRGAFIGFVILIVVFIYRQLILKRSYLPLTVFRKKNVYISLLLFFIMGIFFSTSIIQSTFTSGILKYSSLINAELNIMTAVGAIVGGLLSFFWFKNKLGIKGLVFSGFAVFYNLSYYAVFSVQFSNRD